MKFFEFLNFLKGYIQLSQAIRLEELKKAEEVKRKEYKKANILISINNIRREESYKVGFFKYYNIYPDYHEFMNNEPKYNNYSDEKGRFRYGGYLKGFLKFMKSIQL